MITGKPVSQEKSGSPAAGEPEYLLVGRIKRPHGLHGDVLMEILTDFPERLKRDGAVHLGVDQERKVIASTRSHAQGLLIRFEGIESPEGAGGLRNQAVYVRTAELPQLPAGQAYHHQLLGSKIMDDQGTHLGELAEILETGANDVYVIRQPGGTELLLPAIEGVILQADLANRTVVVRVPIGLESEGRKAPRRPFSGSERDEVGR